MSAPDETRAEAVRRYVEGRSIHGYAEEKYAEWKVEAFMAGAEWQASRDAVATPIAEADEPGKVLPEARIAYRAANPKSTRQVNR